MKMQYSGLLFHPEGSKNTSLGHRQILKFLEIILYISFNHIHSDSANQRDQSEITVSFILTPNLEIMKWLWSEIFLWSEMGHLKPKICILVFCKGLGVFDGGISLLLVWVFVCFWAFFIWLGPFVFFFFLLSWGSCSLSVWLDLAHHLNDASRDL